MNDGRHALIIATGPHDDQAALPKDVAVLSDLLADPNVGGFNVDVVEAELEQSLDAIEQFFLNRGPEDDALFYVFGQTLQNADGDVFFPVAGTNVDLLEATAIPSTMIFSRIDTSKARRVAMFLDANIPHEVISRQIPKRRDLFIIATPAKESRSQATTAQIIADALLTGEADLDRDGSIDLAELITHANTRLELAQSVRFRTWLGGDPRTFIVAASTAGTRRIRATFAEYDDLTEREKEVLRLIADGYSNRQIAENLFLSSNTVARHVSGILRKLGITSRTQAALYERDRAGRFEALVDNAKVSDESSLQDTTNDASSPDTTASTGDSDKTGATEKITRNDALTVIDNPTGVDALGRSSLVAHLGSLLDQLVSRHPEGTAVVHIDGRWGAGKTTLVELLLHPERLSTPMSPWSRTPVTVQYDAWRESTVSPEWWSLASEVHRSVRAQRAWPTRFVMSAVDIISRLRRSPSMYIAGMFLVAATVGAWRGWWNDVSAPAKTIASLAGVGALGLAFGKALFWASPTFGRLHISATDNPLADIAAAVARLRRWTPRNAEAQRKADILFTAVLTVSAALAVADLWFATSATWLMYSACALAIGALLVYGSWTWHGRDEPKQPILLIVDDLDRCDSARVVKLLETIHTLMRERCTPRRLSKWRTPAPLMALVLADGRWLRKSFESTFAAFDSLSSPVHDLGADFTQKVFDHSVWVPALSNAQIQRYLAAITDGPVEESDAEQSSSAATTTRIAEKLIETIDPIDVYSPRVDKMLEPLPTQDRDRLAAQRAMRAIEQPSVERLARHLMSDGQYAAIMPPNPRLIKRVANTYGMLRALLDHLLLSEVDDVVIRAAILYVRFPTLVDEMLSSFGSSTSHGTRQAGNASAVNNAPSGNVSVDDAVSSETFGDTSSLWSRADVQQVLGEHSIERIARCYGFFAIDESTS